MSMGGTILFLWDGEPSNFPAIIGIADGSGVGQPLGVVWPLC